MNFSQRIGKIPGAKLVQRESMDGPLRNSLWNALTLLYWETYTPPDPPYLQSTISYVRGSNLESLVLRLWIHHFKQPVDTISLYWRDCLAGLREHFFNCDWAEAFDFIEFIAECGPPEKTRRFVELCNSYLERENSAYRFVDGRVTEITSEEEIVSVETAITGAVKFPGVTIHLRAALESMSRRSNPDYRNSIKESISAVESLAKHLSSEQDATLGAILGRLEKTHHLHPSLKKAFTALYGYTSDAQGIRHGLTEAPNLTKAEARFMLVCCSAFINYAIDSLSAA